jgi:hypothetical protein
MRPVIYIFTVVIFAFGISREAESDPVLANSLERHMMKTAPIELPYANEVYPLVPTWRETTVLHIGDSHVSAGLTSGLRAYMRQAGARYYKECWVGSSAKSWVVSGQLRQMLKKIRPTVVIITLGTNSMLNRNPSRHATWVRSLVKKIGPRFCYWIGPPPLIDDLLGYNRMLYENTQPCRFFDSRVLDVPKREDAKFHLTKSQGLDWAERIWDWMNGRLFVEPLQANAF